MNHKPFFVLLTIYCILVSLYSSHTPLFEGPDAYYHFAVIDHITRTGYRPPTDNVRERPWRQMAYHAPLYYRVAAVLIAPLDTNNFLTDYPLNPHAHIGEPGTTDNHNMVAHTGDPWRDTGLAARIVRGLSSLLGAATLIGVYWLGLVLFDRQRLALLAVLIVLLNPQFLFMSAVINDDNLVTALSVTSLALLMYIMRRGASLRSVVLLAVLMGANALAKPGGLLLYPIAIAGAIWFAAKGEITRRQAITYISIGVVLFIVIAGGWYLENWQAYGDPTGASLVAEATELRSGTVDYISELRGLFFSFWGLFGWFNIPVAEQFYQWIGVILCVALIGGIWKWSRNRECIEQIIVFLLILYCVLFVYSWARFNMLVLAGQGRLWFPLLGVLACAIAYGLSAYPRLVSLVLILPLAYGAVTFPFTRIAATFSASSQIAVDDWNPPPNNVAIPFREPWRDEACVVLWVSPVEVEESQPITLDLAWEARCPMSGFWSVFVHLADIEQQTCEVGDTRHVLAPI